jgi:hypothetical protein
LNDLRKIEEAELKGEYSEETYGDIIKIYLKDIGKIERLSYEEEVEL